MLERHTCTDCGRRSPPTETAYTLISKEFGWRLTRQVDANGAFVMMKWRCPSCWSRHKERRAAARTPHTPRSGQELSASGEHSRWLLDQAETEAATPCGPELGIRRPPRRWR